MSNAPMSDTPEKLEQKIFNLVYQWGRVGIVADHTAPTYVAYIQELIDSAKREGAIEELRNLPSERHETSGWCDTGFFVDSEDRWERIKQLEQSEKSV